MGRQGPFVTIVPWLAFVVIAQGLILFLQPGWQTVLLIRPSSQPVALVVVMPDRFVRHYHLQCCLNLHSRYLCLSIPHYYFSRRRILVPASMLLQNFPADCFLGSRCFLVVACLGLACLDLACLGFADYLDSVGLVFSAALIIFRLDLY